MGPRCQDPDTLCLSRPSRLPPHPQEGVNTSRCCLCSTPQKILSPTGPWEGGGAMQHSSPGERLGPSHGPVCSSAFLEDSTCLFVLSQYLFTLVFWF